jgi:hypothetical protein
LPGGFPLLPDHAEIDVAGARRGGAIGAARELEFNIRREIEEVDTMIPETL